MIRPCRIRPDKIRQGDVAPERIIHDKTRLDKVTSERKRPCGIRSDKTGYDETR